MRDCLRQIHALLLKRKRKKILLPGNLRGLVLGLLHLHSSLQDPNPNYMLERKCLLAKENKKNLVFDRPAKRFRLSEDVSFEDPKLANKENRWLRGHIKALVDRECDREKDIDVMKTLIASQQSVIHVQIKAKVKLSKIIDEMKNEERWEDLLNKEEKEEEKDKDEKPKHKFRNDREDEGQGGSSAVGSDDEVIDEEDNDD
ncbi:hypothetical protein L1987_09019 [Smallanthus sonchifolius]|uniref:Uncharacterized protein n=1 Tax=Smallanthus sonchifolius TaxID=185202 RepID=A0ACB9JMT6_9ASTR|nr:hypothetical protein L1987_09019 [Smallanthus sonchifolius]